MHQRVIERLARLGFVCIGVVYAIVGFLAATADPTNQSGAIQYVASKPLGKPLLVVMIAGLAGYALWLLASCFADSDRRGSDAKGLAIRAGAMFRALIYSAFIVEIARILTRGHGSGGGSDQNAQHWTARLMAQPFGPWLVGAAGLGVAGYGAYQLYRAWEAKLSKRLHLGAMKAATERKVVAISRIGIGARGIVFLVVGGSLLIAAMRRNPGAAHGTSGALGALPAPALVAVGLGLMAYGIYAFANARYRSIRA